MALSDNKRLGVAPGMPGVSGEVDGAPVSMPGVAVSGGTAASGVSSPARGGDGAGQGDGTAPGDGGETMGCDYGDAVAGIDRKIAAFREYIDRLPEFETPEKRAKREKQEKSKRIIGAVSDGLRAMSNLWFTSQYAPNMYNHEKDSQLNETNRWIDKAKAEREKLREEHLRYAIGLGDAENERAKTLRELEAQQERQRLAREKAQREAKAFQFEESLWPDKQREQAGKATKAEQEAITAQAAADAAPEMQAAKLDTERARKGSYDASAENSRASATANRARAGSYRKTVHHFRGKTYESEKDYTKDVAEAARAYNARHEGEPDFKPIKIEDETRTGYGKKRVARKPEEYAGEVERRLEEENLGKGYGNNDNRGY